MTRTLLLSLSPSRVFVGLVFLLSSLLVPILSQTTCGTTPIDLSTPGTAPLAVSVTGSTGFSYLTALTDGNTNTASYATQPIVTSGVTCAAPAWVKMDLGTLRVITSITLWHYYPDRRNCGQTLEISDTGVFGGEQVSILNTGSDYGPTEYSDGNTYPVNNVVGRYIRHFIGPSNSETAQVRLLEMKVMGYPCSSSSDLNLPTAPPTQTQTQCGSSPIDLTTNQNLLITGSPQFSYLRSLINGVTDAALHSTQVFSPTFIPLTATCSSPYFVTIDLGTLRVITSITVWHYYSDRRYCGQTLEISDTGAFNNEQVYVMNSGSGYGPSEYSDGNTYSVNNVVGRYIRHLVGPSS